MPFNIILLHVNDVLFGDIPGILQQLSQLPQLTRQASGQTRESRHHSPVHGGASDTPTIIFWYFLMI